MVAVVIVVVDTDIGLDIVSVGSVVSWDLQKVLSIFLIREVRRSNSRSLRLNCFGSYIFKTFSFSDSKRHFIVYYFFGFPHVMISENICQKHKSVEL